MITQNRPVTGFMLDSKPYVVLEYDRDNKAHQKAVLQCALDNRFRLGDLFSVVTREYGLKYRPTYKKE